MKEFFKPNAKKIIIFLILILAIVTLSMNGPSFLRSYVAAYLVLYPLAGIRGSLDVQLNDPYIIISFILIKWVVLFYPLSCLIYYYYNKVRK